MDGFPRTTAQTEALKKSDIVVKAVVVLQVDDENIVKRITGRRIDPVTGNSYHLTWKWPPATKEIEDRLVQRADDTEEVVVKRLENYKKQTEAGLSAFQPSLIHKVDGNGTIDEVWLLCRDHFGKL